MNHGECLDEPFNIYISELQPYDLTDFASLLKRHCCQAQFYLSRPVGCIAQASITLLNCFAMLQLFPNAPLEERRDFLTVWNWTDEEVGITQSRSLQYLFGRS